MDINANRGLAPNSPLNAPAEPLLLAKRGRTAGDPAFPGKVMTGLWSDLGIPSTEFFKVVENIKVRTERARTGDPASKNGELGRGSVIHLTPKGYEVLVARLGPKPELGYAAFTLERLGISQDKLFRAIAPGGTKPGNLDHLKEGQIVQDGRGNIFVAVEWLPGQIMLTGLEPHGHRIAVRDPGDGNFQWDLKHGKVTVWTPR